MCVCINIYIQYIYILVFTLLHQWPTLYYVNVKLNWLVCWPCCFFFFFFIANVAELTQDPDSAAQCQQRECFSAQISTPHKCLALCLTLSGPWLSGRSSRGQALTLKDSCAWLCVWGVRDEVRCFSRYKLLREDTCAKKATRTLAKSLFLGEFKGWSSFRVYS